MFLLTLSAKENVWASFQHNQPEISPDVDWIIHIGLCICCGYRQTILSDVKVEQSFIIQLQQSDNQHQKMTQLSHGRFYNINDIIFLLFLKTPQLHGPEQQLHGGSVDGLRHLLVHRLWRRGASHILRSQHLPPHWDHGERTVSPI